MSDPNTPDHPHGPPGPHATPEMSLDRLRAILDAYGAAPERWPAAERTAAVLLLDSSEQARRAHAEAMRLDIVLDQATAPPPPPELADRLRRRGASGRGFLPAMADRLSGRFAGLRNFSNSLLRPAAFALTALAGIAIGMAVPRGEDPGRARTAAIAPAADRAAPAALAPDELSVRALSIVDGGLNRDLPAAGQAAPDAGETNGGAANNGPLDDIPLI